MYVHVFNTHTVNVHGIYNEINRYIEYIWNLLEFVTTLCIDMPITYVLYVESVRILIPVNRILTQGFFVWIDCAYNYTAYNTSADRNFSTAVNIVI